MTESPAPIPVVLEIGPKRVIASALNWPGWARSGRDEPTALETLLAYAARYARAVRSTTFQFAIPVDAQEFSVTERIAGNATTDYGVPALPPEVDGHPATADDLSHLRSILDACWDAFAAAVASAAGRELRKGPRGGGRDSDKIVEHVVDSHFGYLRQIAWREPHNLQDNLAGRISAIKEIETRALAFAASDEMPTSGPRGGKLRTPRYFVRRAAWHILDHAWEIEDRLDG